MDIQEGKQHSQKDMPAFLRESIYYAEMAADRGLLVRPDSRHDSLENIAICLEEKADWLIKRNLRREDLQGWLKVARETGKRAASR